MHIEAFREYCLAKAGVTEGLPFGEDTLVFKVMGKMFALISISNPVSVNLKCDPEYAIELREEHPEAVLPGYHMNKKQWNTVMLNLGLSRKLLLALIDQSYDLVVEKLSRAEKAALAELKG